MDFFTIPELGLDQTELLQENIHLKSQLCEVRSEYQLVKKTISIFGFQIQYRRLPNSTSKDEILAAIINVDEFIDDFIPLWYESLYG